MIRICGRLICLEDFALYGSNVTPRRSHSSFKLCSRKNNGVFRGQKLSQKITTTGSNSAKKNRVHCAHAVSHPEPVAHKVQGRSTAEGSD